MMVVLFSWHVINWTCPQPYRYHELIIMTPPSSSPCKFLIPRRIVPFWLEIDHWVSLSSSDHQSKNCLTLLTLGRKASFLATRTWCVVPIAPWMYTLLTLLLGYEYFLYIQLARRLGDSFMVTVPPAIYWWSTVHTLSTACKTISNLEEQGT